MKKVFVALSSGVDSAIAAHLLIKKGYAVSAAHMRLYNTKTARENEKKAKEIASFLNIPFYVFDFTKEFQKEIVGDFLESYKSGKTPNPCVLCNKEIKFGLFLKRAFDMGADMIATGHYAKKRAGFIYKARDTLKDQSYFLWSLSSSQLEKTIFPLGEMAKKDVKKMALKIGLKASEESQEVCFIENRTSEFLKKYLKAQKGDILNEEKEKIGEHFGSFFFTIGQRRGLDLPGGPFFVYKKDDKKNLIYVTKKEDLLLKKELRFKKANWFSKYDFPFQAKSKIRYQGKEIPCMVFKNRAVFKFPQKAIAEGQSVVFYKNNKLLGGGVIYA